MQETLLTLRGIHRLCIAGCVTVLLLAMTPNLANRYQDALDELQQLELNYAAFDHTRIDEYESEYSSYEMEDEDTEFSDLIRRWIAVDLTNDGGLETSWTFQPDIRDRVLPRFDASRESFVGLDRPLSELSLAELYEINASPDGHLVQIFVPDRIELKQKLIKILAEKIPEHYSWEKRFPWQEEPDLSPRTITVRVRFPPVTSNYIPGIGERIPTSVPFVVECGLKDEELAALWMDTVSAKSREVYEMSMAAELTSDLSHSRRLWSEVHGLTASDAIELLKQRKADTTADVTVMGFRFPKHIALLLGPLVTAILFLYLQLHVKHAIPRMRRHGWQAEDFPWIAFYRDRTSRLVTVCTFVYLPLVSCGMLWISEMKLSDEFPWTIAGCTLFCAASGVTTLARIRSMPVSGETAPSNTVNESQVDLAAGDDTDAAATEVAATDEPLKLVA